MGMILYTPTPKTGTITVSKEVVSNPVVGGYGQLYNWYAATDPRNIASEGYFVPEQSDFETLFEYLGNGYDLGGGNTGYDIGNLIQDLSLLYWQEFLTGGTNETNLSFRGSGIRFVDGSFTQIQTRLSLLTIENLEVSTNSNYPTYTISSVGYLIGKTVRLFRPATESELILPDGLITATYTGNDGKVYPLTKIGTQIWLAENLNEMKYRDGTLIPEVTDNAEWVALAPIALPEIGDTAQGGLVYNLDDGDTGFWVVREISVGYLGVDDGYYNLMKWDEAAETLPIINAAVLDGYGDWVMATRLQWVDIGAVVGLGNVNFQADCWTSEDTTTHAWLVDPTMSPPEERLEPKYMGDNACLKVIRHVNVTSGGARCYYDNNPAYAESGTSGDPVTDETYFHVTLTGQRAVDPFVVEGDIKQGEPARFRELPFDTYIITEDSKEGYVTSDPVEVTVSRQQRIRSVTITNVIEEIDPLALELTWDDIENVPVADASSVSDWNTFFDLPANKGLFEKVEVFENLIKLHGGSEITIRDSLFSNTTHLVGIDDKAGCIIGLGKNSFRSGLITAKLPSLLSAGEDSFFNCTSLVNTDFSSLQIAGNYCFYNCSALVNPDFGSLQTAGEGCFYNCSALVSSDFSSLQTAGNYCFRSCTSLLNSNFSSLLTAGNLCFYHCNVLLNSNFSSLLTAGNSCFRYCAGFTNINLPVITNIGTTTGSNSVFNNITGKTITLTIPSALMTCNGGAPDGDIAYLIANNTVTIFDPLGNQLYP